MTDDIIQSDNPLSKDQTRTLASILDMIIPPSDDGRMPGASEVDVPAYIQEQSGEAIPLIVEGLASLDEMSETKYNKDFSAITGSDRQELLGQLQTAQPLFVQTLVSLTVTCYYQHDRVLEALGMRPGPPFPEGYEVEAGDLSLLDPVRKRGKLYRE